MNPSVSKLLPGVVLVSLMAWLFAKEEATDTTPAPPFQEAANETAKVQEDPKDSLPLVRVSISPESRVKADDGGAPPKLRQSEWTEFPILIENSARITSPLIIESAQLMQAEDDTHRDRWMKLKLKPEGPLTGNLREERTLRIWSRDTGKRSAVLNANAGQGTQDLGFRSDVLITFDIEPSATNAKAMSEEAHDLLNLMLELVQLEATQHQQRLIDGAWSLYDGWLRHGPPPTGTRQAWLSEAKDCLAPVLEDMSVIDAQAPEPINLVRGLESVVVIRHQDKQGRLRHQAKKVTPDSELLELPEFQLRVPVTLVEPAILRGRITEGNSAIPYPGRLKALGPDGVFRKGEQFKDNSTLSEKNLLQFIFAGRGANYSLPFFYSDGTFELRLPPGRTKLTLERGFEHPLVDKTIDLKSGETREINMHSKRFVDMRSEGWVSGDTHIHWAKNWWSEDEDIELLKLVQRAEDLRVANNLTLKHHTHDQNFIAPTQFPMGPIPGLCDDDFHAQQAEEYRNEEFYGHIILLNIKRLIEPISTGFMGGQPERDWPPNTHAIREARRQGGISIEAHGLGRNNDVPVNVAQGLSDALDQIPPEDYYRFLDCGFHIPLSNGSDHPARVTGCCRVYVKTELPFNYDNWIDGLRKNRTFTTSGPLLSLKANGADIGDVLDLKAGTSVKVSARALSRHPLGRFEIVVNGKVEAAVDSLNREEVLELEFTANEPSWIVARASRSESFNALDGPDIAHTSAIYIDVDGNPRIVPGAAKEWIRRMEIHADDIKENGRFENDSQRAEAVGHVHKGIDVYRELSNHHTHESE